ncbi:helix-turn-helix transcriptional regulator [Variovorax sp. VNK109]|uniref:AraC family transcriptional regulator n=1 Tax=Variovorax sp. VNK109 TaxID=3400919 RepID=UPI003C0F963F
MPRQRTLLHEDATVRIERVTSGLPTDRWSASYEAETSRWVLPEGGCTEFRTEDGNLLVDGTTAMHLPCALPYRMKPGEGVQESVVVSAMHPPATEAVEAQRSSSTSWCLQPLAVWRLHCLWRDLARGDAVDGNALHDLPVPLCGQRLHPPGDEPASHAVLRARRFMAQRASVQDFARWTLHDVADAAHVSSFHLARVFRRQVGTSLHGYRQRLRLAEAMRRLRHGERDLAGLSHDLGFSGQSHFGQVFVQAIGTTPSRARARLSR